MVLGAIVCGRCPRGMGLSPRNCRKQRAGCGRLGSSTGYPRILRVSSEPSTVLGDSRQFIAHASSCGEKAKGRKTSGGTPSAEECSGEAVLDTFDHRMMRMALDIASTPGPGTTDPNPMVGCVIVGDDGCTVVGHGYHPKAGLPHAEVYALRAAGQRARGGTAYVTLEPCDHYGRTPPCSQALIDAGIVRVVVGVGDPNPLVAGGGIARLRRAGIEVVVGCEEALCFEINKGFMERMMKKMA